jgi:hypothetical protein
MRSTKMSKASFILGSEDAAMVPKFVVPVMDFQPDSLLRISSAREMCREEVEDGESFPTLVA